MDDRSVATSRGAVQLLLYKVLPNYETCLVAIQVTSLMVGTLRFYNVQFCYPQGKGPTWAEILYTVRERSGWGGFRGTLAHINRPTRAHATKVQETHARPNYLDDSPGMTG